MTTSTPNTPTADASALDHAIALYTGKVNKAAKAERLAEACPACNCQRGYRVNGDIQLHACQRCGAIFGTCYRGTSYGLVWPYFASWPVPQDEQGYFDFTVLCGDGTIQRRHGWYDRRTGFLTQVG